VYLVKTKKTRKEIAFKVGAVCLSFCLATGAIEGYLEVRNSNHYMIFVPYRQTAFKPDSTIIYGVSGVSHVRINSLGLRGDETFGDAGFHIITLGASTTECVYLDQDKSWPALLQSSLNAEMSAQKTWVGNAGISGRRSAHHLIELKRLCEQLPWVDMMIVLMGVNDLQYRLSSDSGFIEKSQSTLLHESFTYVPRDSSVSFVKRSEIFKLLSSVKRVLAPAPTGQTLTGDQLSLWRENRHHARAFIDSLPDISDGLREYESNIKQIIAVARENKKKLLFLTQPTIWKESMTEYEKSIIWFGWIGRYQTDNSGRYYSVSALRRGMDAYNETLIHVCQAYKVDCLDLAAILPKDTTIFYDDCHFNEHGAEVVSKELTRHLLSMRKDGILEMKQ